MKPRLLIDSDNVLSNFVESALGVLKELTGETYTPEQVTEYDIMKSLGIPADITEEAYRLMKVPGFCRDIPVFPGAEDGMARLKGYADIFVVTSPLGDAPLWAGEREKWLWKYFGITRKRIVSAPTKYVIAGDIFVDDKTSALVEWERFHDGIAVQWTTPHNLNDGWTGVTTNNWTELLGIVKAVDDLKRPRHRERSFRIETKASVL